MTYAVIDLGNKQEKVSIGDIITVNRTSVSTGETIDIPVLLFVGENGNIIHDSNILKNIKATAVNIKNLRGPKIVIQKYKNKTGYKKRQGHRQDLTCLQITKINTNIK